MRLQTLLEGIYFDDIPDLYRDWPIEFISSDSRQVEKNSIFVALEGSKFDGKNFIHDAIEKGARVIVTNKELGKDDSNEATYYLQVEDTSIFLRAIAKKFYGDPSQQVKAIGVTGTNGKTTVAYLIESILYSAGKTCGVIGTVNHRIGGKIFPSSNTTPSFLENQQFFSDMVKDGIEYCVMEVSSHALVQRRVDLIHFSAAVFTNLTSDHLDYHKTTDNYFAAKALLFQNLSMTSTAVINVDDLYGSKLVSMTPAKIMAYGIKNNADVMAKDIHLSVSGTEFKLYYPDGNVTIRTNLVGAYNVYNILAAIAACLSLEISLDKIKQGIELLNLVPGRLERVDCGQPFTILIDFAHTQDALENVLKTLRATSDAKIILVFGCGGDRDKTKRPAMGKVASQWADFAIVTSDNPRSEDPQSIVDQIVQGFAKDNYKAIVDRQEAIKKAVEMASPGDIVLIAGKGHEVYQIFNNRMIKFDERQIVSQLLRC